MCGIIGYIGSKQAQPVLLDGLKRMEYRGYDSAGIAVVEDAGVALVKKQGKLQNLLSELENVGETVGSVGIGHIRWATHGIPNDVNAHPHAGGKESPRVYVVHNGIIENYADLKERLKKEGYSFDSETDTEVLAHLIDLHIDATESLYEAVRQALQEVTGAYGIAVVSVQEPDTIVAARMGSPLVLGVVEQGEYVIASDPTPILSYTRDVVYLEEGEIVEATRLGHTISTLDNESVNRDTSHIEWDVQQAEKQGYPHFMLKELMEIPEILSDGIRGRLLDDDGAAHLGGFMETEERWRDIERIVLVACGGASIASDVIELMLEEYAGIPTTVVIGSEFRYRKPVVDEKTAVVVISQSGETADTIASLREAKRHGILTFGIVNVVGSTLAREVDAGMYIHAGPEIAVASTKAMAGMVNMGALFTLALARQRGMSLVMGQRVAKELRRLPELVLKVLESAEHIQAVARKYAHFEHAFYLGRKYNVASAKEGALKLKEIAYVHAESYPSGELKHGPLALMDDRFFSVFIAPEDSVFEKSVSNIQEVKARSGIVIGITTEGGVKDLSQICEDIIVIPKTIEMLMPVLAFVVVQLFSYYVALELGRDIDQPRNLAKSVTVE